VLSDLDLGMNQWMSQPFEYPAEPVDRGKVLTAEDIHRLGGWARYRDVDGDGVGWRTLPGTDHPLAAYFTRGTGHNDQSVYSERADDWEMNMARLQRKFDTARQLVPKPWVDTAEGAAVGLIGFGSSDAPLQEARDRLAKIGIAASYLRVRALPMDETVRDYIAGHERVYVIELNSDGQLARLLHMEFPDLATRVISLAHSNGLPLSARWITLAVQQQER
jgi:2-oxoglutarate ferredoxin oxidoreductase subunit alpha